MMLPVAPRSIWLISNEPGSVRLGWPTNSSSVRGRRRSARGATDCNREETVTLGRFSGVASGANASSSSLCFRVCAALEEEAAWDAP